MNFRFFDLRNRILFVILALGALVRLGVLLENYNSLDLDASFVIQGELARNILKGNGFSTDSAYVSSVLLEWRSKGKPIDLEEILPPAQDSSRPEYLNEPGYGLLLAGMWKVFGSSRWIYVRILQVILDLFMIWCIYRIGSLVWEDRIGIVCALLYAVFIPHVEIVVRPHRDVWVTFAYILSVLALVKLARTQKYRTEILMVVGLGALLAVVAWMRSTVVAYVGFCCLAMFLVRPHRKTVLLALFMLGAFALLLSPLAIRNYSAFGKIMITRGAIWHSFWGGIGQFPNSYGMKENDEFIARYFEQKNPNVRYGTDDYEKFLKEEAGRLIREQPLWYASTVIRRGIVILMPKIGRELFVQQEGLRPQGIANLHISRSLLLVIDGVLFLGLIGGILVSRSKGGLLFVAALPLFYTLLTLSPLYVVGRNILNSYFVTLMFSGVALDYVRGALQKRGGVSL